MSNRRIDLQLALLKAAEALARYENVSTLAIPFGDRIACFGTRADILDLLRDDKQWVEYKGVD